MGSNNSQTGKNLNRKELREGKICRAVDHKWFEKKQIFVESSKAESMKVTNLKELKEIVAHQEEV